MLLDQECQAGFDGPIIIERSPSDMSALLKSVSASGGEQALVEVVA